MATARPKAQPIGSAQWMQTEREQVRLLLDQEVEEFGFSVRSELEWLNEHMAEVFSQSSVNFADVFKTPGKLRGKTPRTARKQNALGTRQPLTDIFAPTVVPPPSTHKTDFLDQVAQFQIAEDVDNRPPAHRPMSRSRSPQRIGKPGNIDSGYHGMTEDEMDIDPNVETATSSRQQSLVQMVPLRENQPRPQPVRFDTAEIGGTSDDSFVSAKENVSNRDPFKEQSRQSKESDNGFAPIDEMEIDQEVKKTISAPFTAKEGETEAIDHDMADDASHSLSDASSPEKPLQRKSSFTFTALPAREPLAAKHSIGARNSQIDVPNQRGSILGRSLGGKSMGIAQNDEDEYAQDKSEESKVHNKTSTQSLHERIKLLGKTKEARPSKSIPQSVLASQGGYPQLPYSETDTAVPSTAVNHVGKMISTVEDSDDDWIAPSEPVRRTVQAAKQQDPIKESSPVRPIMHQKSISTAQASSSRVEATADSRQQKAQSVSIPNFMHVAGEVRSTTPAGSPIGKKHHDGPLSASKSKLYSVLKSAKNIFASSASASAAAKLEAHSNSPSRSPAHEFAESRTAAVFNMPGALYSEKQIPQSPGRPNSIISALSQSPSKRTLRSSNESDKKKEKELKAQQKAEVELEKARVKERAKAAKEQGEREKAIDVEVEAAKKQAQNQAAAESEQQRHAGDNFSNEEDMPPPPPSKVMVSAGKLRAPGRLVKPTREPAQPGRPAPVSIRVASQSQRLGQVPSSSSLNKSQRENAAPLPPPKNNIRTTSAQGSVRSSTAPNNARVKALEAAARKKEADEKAAQRKAEQKRELERKRAAKVEEERRAEEERKVAEQQRIQEAKLAVQRQAEKQAADAKRREQQRLEQMRQQEEAQKSRAAHDLAEAIRRERTQQTSARPHGDVAGTLRLLAKNTISEAQLKVQPNTAKPAKRAYQADEDEQGNHQQQPQLQPQPQRPVMARGPPSYQQTDAKRRRTNDEEQPPQAERPSVMAPPKRPSNMRKESTLSKFPHGYTHAPPPAAHHAASMFKSTVTAQHQLQHPTKPMAGSHPNQMVQLSNARIPFAENANPPIAQHHHQQSQMHYYGSENMQPGTSNKYKTPIRPAHAPKSAKSSPLYPNVDNIALPEIATDSEDEDSEDEDTGFRAPSWVASPALRDLLTQQQLVDPETVFGPIGELKMDEVFRNGKNQERLKRFRDRGSSAAWVESGDAVTSAEKRKDMELRERVVRDGGWRYEPSK